MSPDGPIAYPETVRDTVVEELAGRTVPDPWRWLEGDVRTDERVQAWVAAEGALTESYLDTLPGRVAIRDRLMKLWNYERVSLPRRRGGRYFFLRNSGLEAQAVLCAREAQDAPARILLDPNGWSEDGATALGEWEPSKDGRRLAYAVQDGGSDWRTVKVLDAVGGEELADEVRWVKFSGLSWAGNGSGFFYSRFPEPRAGLEHQAQNLDHAIYFHRLGTDQSTDFLVYATPDRPRLIHGAEVSEDGRWLLISSAEGTEARTELTVIDLTAPKLAPKILVRGLDNDWRLAGSKGDIFYFVTDLEAPRRRIVSIDVGSEMRRRREIVPHGEDLVADALVVGDRLLVSLLRNVASELRIYDLDGRLMDTVVLPGIGTVSGMEGQGDSAEAFFAFTSYDRPTEIHRLDVGSAVALPYAQPELQFDREDFVVDQASFTSKDGTVIPLFLLRRKDVTGAAPALLYGYGGFEISLTPGFSSAALCWAAMGGVYAVANIRGGGEYGKAWHDAGRRANKQNVFDDFIAAAEHLKGQGVASSVSVHGHSNGGLLVAAVTNQRPDLFAAALPAVGVHDMTRFHRFTAGRYWIDDYGDPGRQEDLAVLMGYSPLHNIRDGAEYPAILIATADTDDRVVPAHSFKYAAALQAADIGPKPHLIRIETRAGHGAGKPTAKQIEEIADLWAFAAHWGGLNV
ncbi:prolyl oligopeptidase family serine peptidase [Sphingomonas oryzagri]|uniref:prolyl oligopeptidase n=1 Tax=Sphingomonas oryzagri TaxID=3042314 RepID=A0ABT6N6Y1_9SPHN|nr:prolyl oligopeptidase family serine peptidase [Sphingomonas oryzagri]MDH7640867.1 prolyl oligopeptidase family serine peptidase [Sphingomonas oryzagri]